MGRQGQGARARGRVEADVCVERGLVLLDRPCRKQQTHLAIPIMQDIMLYVSLTVRSVRSLGERNGARMYTVDIDIANADRWLVQRWRPVVGRQEEPPDPDDIILR